MSAAERWWEHVAARLADGLRAIPDGERGDVYVVTVVLARDEDDDARLAPVDVCWNTERALAATIAQLPRIEPAWHRWDIGGFVASPGLRIGVLPDDPAGVELRAAWGRELGAWYGDDADLDTRLERGVALHRALATGLVTTIAQMHADGVIVELFDRPIPVTIGSDDSHDPAGAWSAAANPPELHAQFAAFYEEYTEG